MPVYYGKGGRYSGKPRVVVLGSGWGAMSFIKSLSRRERCAEILSFWSRNVAKLSGIIVQWPEPGNASCALLYGTEKLKMHSAPSM